MMTSVSSSKASQNLLVAALLLIGFLVIFFAYYSPATRGTECLRVSSPSQNLSAETCLRVLKTHPGLANMTCQPDLAPPPDATPTPPPPDTLMLIWHWPFGFNFGLGSCEAYHVQGCRLTDDRALFQQAHGVMIHHRDISGDLSNLPQLPRPFFQKWVWYNMESPTHTSAHGGLNGLFNLTSSYRLDSDVPVPYGSLLGTAPLKNNISVPAKDKLVCWIVSNYNPNHRRSHFFSEFEQHIRVEAYGGHFGRRISHEEYASVVSSCKFYLSFENSVHRDYMTEKLFNVLTLGTVPVVLGPPRTNYEMLVPGHAFVHVEDFPSARELAEHLKMLDQDEERYRSFFSWREDYTVWTGTFGLEHTCRACDHIRRNNHYRVVKDLTGWFWS